MPVISEAEVQEQTIITEGAKVSGFKNFFAERQNLILGLLSVAVFVAGWEIVGQSGIINPLFISSPSRVAGAFAEIIADGSIWNHLRTSFTEFIIGYGMAVLLGIGLGVLMGWYSTIDDLLNPLVAAMYATPSIAFMSLLIIWFGVSILSKVAVIFLFAFFPTLINTMAGIKAIDSQLVKVARSYGASDANLFKTVAIPGAVPFILTGLRLALARGLIGVFVAEMYASTAGVGYLITNAGAMFKTDLVLAGVLIFTGTGIAASEILKRVESHFDAWRPQR